MRILKDICSFLRQSVQKKSVSCYPAMNVNKSKLHQRSDKTISIEDSGNRNPVSKNNIGSMGNDKD